MAGPAPFVCSAEAIRGSVTPVTFYFFWRSLGYKDSELRPDCFLCIGVDCAWGLGLRSLHSGCSRIIRLHRLCLSIMTLLCVWNSDKTSNQPTPSSQPQARIYTQIHLLLFILTGRCAAATLFRAYPGPDRTTPVTDMPLVLWEILEQRASFPRSASQLGKQ